MKLIQVDNFDGEGPNSNDVVIAENVDEYYGRHILEFLIAKFSTTYSPYYFRLVEDDYKLKRFEP